MQALKQSLESSNQGAFGRLDSSEAGRYLLADGWRFGGSCERWLSTTDVDDVGRALNKTCRRDSPYQDEALATWRCLKEHNLISCCGVCRLKACQKGWRPS